MSEPPTTTSAAAEDLPFHHSSPAAPDGPSPSTIPFSSGNPRIEETRGIMHLFPLSPLDLPVGRKPLVCVLEVPNHMTYADFCQFCGSFIQHMLEMRIVRRDGVDDKYSAIVRFDEQSSSDEFYRHFHGKIFSSLEIDSCEEVDVCRVRFVVDVHYTASIEHAPSSITNSMEQPSCPVCLDRLDQDTGGILTTICNHSFHCSCISKWTDSSCPVCRYCQQQPEKSTCSICGTSENLWMCVICGFVGCGRYKEGHAIKHWKESQHCYSMELETQRVWDYVGDNYVHRLIQSKTDGKLVELNYHCAHSKDLCSNCECIGDSGVNEALLNSKVEAVVEEYNVLLTSQLESQRNYFESLLLDVKDETDKEISEAVQKAVSSKHQKLQLKLDKCSRERNFLADLNETLLKNQDMWKMKIQEVEEREQKAVKLREEKINALEEQLRDLMIHIETGKAIDGMPAGKSKEIKDSIILPVPASESSSKSVGSKRAQKSHKRKT